ncbi:DUF3558 domain-containing protein [Nocardia farcinica]|uniref:DUF3558 domain-containing protein n=1 Tax=Nocardia farcinica TaxID=37329 RepID=UPI0018934D34|nr:DUF3558 domain-containing protein [Nocardia farcinica]MBF6232244.1 DUF3558 domain-containing protein [Nocardia farcinica]
MRRVLVIVAAAAVVPVLGACGGTTSGTATTSTSAVEVALWNPCTEIPEDILSRTGVDPHDVEAGIAGVPQSGWEICSWAGPEYFLTVFSTSRTVQEIREKPGNVEFNEIDAAGRRGVQYRVEGAAMHLDCDIVFPAQQGSVTVKIGNRAGEDDVEDPCVVAQRVAAQLVPILPE